MVEPHPENPLQKSDGGKAPLTIGESRPRLRHVRGGKEMPVILEDNAYDFNFQVCDDIFALHFIRFQFYSASTKFSKLSNLVFW
jgi:hypothetical protein